MRITKYLTDEEFNEVIKKLRLSERNQKIAKAILVDKYRPNDLAKDLNIPRQRIDQITRRVWLSFLKTQSIPKDWVSVRVALPKEEAEKVLKKEAELKALSLKSKFTLDS